MIVLVDEEEELQSSLDSGSGPRGFACGYIGFGNFFGRAGRHNRVVWRE